MCVAYVNTAPHSKSPESLTRLSAANSVPMVCQTAWLFVTMELLSAGSVVLPFDHKKGISNRIRQRHSELQIYDKEGKAIFFPQENLKRRLFAAQVLCRK